MRSIHLQRRALPQPGRVVAERYRLVRPLLGVAPSNLWIAEHREHSRRVALEFLHPSIADDAELLENFLREAGSAARVVGEGVARVLDYGVDAGGHPFVALDLPEGESLVTRLRAHGTLSLAELESVIGDSAEALQQAHELGLVHGNLKPANLFLAACDGQERTKVLFSIARITTDTLELVRQMTGRTSRRVPPEAPSAPYSGVAYMSPEQVLGSDELDFRTDLWSLAVVAFECMTGSLPFPGDTEGERLVQICTAPPLLSAGLARLPADFEGWFLRALDKSRDGRFASAREMAAAFRGIWLRTSS
jgi:eukaryotic-like serine/threonine-protein kinase